MIKNVGTIAGKPAHTYPAQPRATLEMLRQRLRQFPTYLTLAQLGAISARMLGLGQSMQFVAGLPLQAHAIPYLSLVSIESSNDYRGEQMTDRGLASLTSMYLSLSTPENIEALGERRGGLEHILLTSQTLGHQADMRNQTARTICLFKDLWQNTPQAKRLDPLADLSRMTGLDLDRILFFGQSFSGAPDGYSFPFKASVATIFDPEAQRAFLRWVSADYDRIRECAKLYRNPSLPALYDLYRFNPLTVYPMVRPDVNPNPSRGQAYLVPCPRLLYERVGRGLYHELANEHRGAGSENPFRTAFGFVFQEYVGTLLRDALGANNVLTEVRYRGADGDVDTVDWIVFQDEQVVLIEVKQSSVTLGTKTTGDLDVAMADLRRTIAKATSQLTRTETDIGSGRAVQLERLSAANHFEKLVVTYDDLHWGNSFLRDIIAEDIGEATARHVHFASIVELEYLLGACERTSLPELLRRKRLGPDGANAMDFQDWLAREFPSDCANAFLEARYDRAMAEWGVPPPLRRRNPPTLAR